MKNILSLAIGALAIAGFAITSHAQTAAPEGAVEPGHPRVNQVDSRQRTQDARVAKGEQSGEMTKKETKNIEKRKKSIQHEKAQDQREHGGHVTKSEQEHLNDRQDKVSKSIDKDKHNDKVQ